MSCVTVNSHFELTYSAVSVVLGTSLAVDSKGKCALSDELGLGMSADV